MAGGKATGRNPHITAGRFRRVEFGNSILIVNKGEIVALSRRVTEITYATIEVPAPPSERNRDVHEKSFLQWRQAEMQQRYEQGEAKRARAIPHNPDKVSHDQKGRMID